MARENQVFGVHELERNVGGGDQTFMPIPENAPGDAHMNPRNPGAHPTTGPMEQVGGPFGTQSITNQKNIPTTCVRRNKIYPLEARL